LQRTEPLVIAHRLATIRNADKIAVVTEEGIAEEGSHDELITKGGIFANLHRVQFRNNIEPLVIYWLRVFCPTFFNKYCLNGCCKNIGMLPLV
jgi:hypothetical protein